MEARNEVRLHVLNCSNTYSFVWRLGLHCLLSTDEGVILGDTINMFYSFALTRLDLTGLEEV